MYSASTKTGYHQPTPLTFDPLTTHAYLIPNIGTGDLQVKILYPHQAKLQSSDNDNKENQKTTAQKHEQ